MMPPPNGFELRKMMSLDSDLASIPFIFLTARSNLEGRVGGIELYIVRSIVDAIGWEDQGGKRMEH